MILESEHLYIWDNPGCPPQKMLKISVSEGLKYIYESRGFVWKKSLGLGQTSLFSCAEPNANELKQRLFFIYIRFGA